MGICSSRPPPRDYEPEPEPAQPPESPTWKLPVFPAPALPPLTRQNKIIIASSRYCEDEEEKIKTKKCVLNGMGEALSIVFDAGDLLEEFIPEVKKLFNLAMTITSIELHTAQLDVEADFLQSFLDTLPSHGELRAFSLVVARETPLVFASVSGLLYRNPGLQALRLWGVDLTPAGSGNQFYPACKLLRVDIAHCTMFPQQIDNLLGASKDSLLCLKIDRPVGLSGSAIARAVNNFGRKVQMLTILLPEESESEMDMKASYLVGDTASRFPASLKYLHLGGLAASDNLFTVTPPKPDAAAAASKGGRKDGSSSTAPLQSHLKHLVALRLDNCPRLSVNGLFAAVRQKSMPNLLRLHVYWLENDEMQSDVELWKSFAASEDISVDVETEGLVWITAMKDVPSGAAAVEARAAEEQTSKHGSKKKHKHVQVPQQAHLGAQQQQLSQAQYLAPPGSYPPAGMPVAAGVMPMAGMAGMASSYPGMAVLNPNPYAAGSSPGLQPGAHSHGSSGSASSSRSRSKHRHTSRSRGYSASHGHGSEHRPRHKKRRSAESSDSETEVSESDSDDSSSGESDSQDTAYHSSRSRRTHSPAGGRSRSSSKSRDRTRH